MRIHAINRVTIHEGDCLQSLRAMPGESVHCVVTDPPYGLSFMGKKWDYDVPPIEVWQECLRVLKPGGHLLAFAGTRTQHRMAVRIEDAGFEIRDMIAWVYGSGFPKSLDVSKAIDKEHGENRNRQLQFTAWMRTTGITAEQINQATCSRMASHYLTDKEQPAIATADMFDKLRPYLPEVPEYVERLVCERTGLEWTAYKQREVLGVQKNAMSGWDMDGGTKFGDRNITAPATPEAQRWQGWGTALKPSHETITWATKPVVNLPELHSIRWSLLRKEAQLWLMLFVSAAENSSALSQSEFAVACGFAQWSADDARSTLAGLCGQMDTSQCASAINTTLNTVSSWRSILDAVCEAMNTSTIATKLSTITDWTTWNFCLSQITLADIIQEHSPRSGASSSASSAVRAFQGWIAFCKSILGHFATENAIAKVAQDCQAAGVSPNMEPCIMARKPLSGTVAETVLQHGTGALNVDGCRVGTEDTRAPAYKMTSKGKEGGGFGNGMDYSRIDKMAGSACGRWPANLIHDGSDEVTGLFPDDGESSAARYFYCAKADSSERRNSKHPTVKPLALMRYLCRLVCPPDGIVLDPFCGSGTTLEAARLEGFGAIGCELNPEYIQDCKERLKQGVLF